MLINIYSYCNIINNPCASNGMGISVFIGGFHKMESTTEKRVRVEEGEYKTDDQIR